LNIFLSHNLIYFIWYFHLSFIWVSRYWGVQGCTHKQIKKKWSKRTKARV